MSFALRSMPRLMLFLLALASICSPAGAAQPDDLPILAEPRFESVSLDRRDGQAVVTALAVDALGRLWVGSMNGLRSFDGLEFHSDDRLPAAGANTPVRALLAARDGRFWVGREFDGLFALPPAGGGGAPRAYVVPQLHKVALRTLAEDADGSLLIGTLGHGLLQLDPVSGAVRALGAADGLGEDQIESLLLDRAGGLWVGGWHGLWYRPPRSARFEPRLPRLAGQLITRMLQASDGRIWIGTRQGGLLLLDASGHLLDEPGRDAGTMVLSMIEASPNRIWVGRASGIEVRDLDGRVLRTVQRNPLRRSTLGDDGVQLMQRDAAGGIWVASYGGGLQRYDPQATAVWVLHPEPGQGRPGDEINARSLLQLDNGEIWVGTNSEGVLRLGPDLRRRGTLPAGPGGIGDGGVAALAQTRDGSVWLGLGSGTGLWRLNRQGQRLEHLQPGGGGVRRLVAMSDGSLWIGLRDGARRLWKGQLEPLQLADGKALRGTINAMVQTADGHVFVGTDQGLTIAAPGSIRLQAMPSAPGEGLSHAAIVGLLIDSAGRLWVDTAQGLNRLQSWDGKQARFEHVSERLGRGDHAFGANMMEDSQGRIWAHTGVYDPKDGSLELLGPADGVDFGTAWFRSYTRLADGRMLVGGSKGVLVIQPERFRAWTYAPEVVCTGLRVAGRVRELGAGPLRLEPDEQGLTVSFAALDYSDAGASRYAYRLLGLDERWTETSAQARSVSFAHLAPGNYRFQVRATNRSGHWSAKELDLPVVVVAPWWQTAWARAGFAVLAAVGLWGLVQLRTVWLRRRRMALEALVAERTRELEVMARQLEDASLSDPLTGMRNRRFFTLNIEADAALSLRRHAGPGPTGDDADLCFFLLDLDNFKQINDRHGHPAGDALLRQMRGRLASVFRESDHLVRWGGEEFLVLARATSRRHAAELAERVRMAVAGEPFKLDDGNSLTATCSIGFAAFPLSPEHPRAFDWSATLSLADAALYEAKRTGRNTWCGLVGVRGLPEAALAAGKQRPREWLASGQLEVVRPELNAAS